MTVDTAADVVVVGGGTAGCVVAARLAGEFGLRVVLVERGPLEPSAAPVDPFPDIAGGIGVETVDVVTERADGNSAMFSAARLGGGSAVNGLIAEPCLPDDFDRWHGVHGCSGWSWDEAAADADAVARLLPTMPAPAGPVGEALAAATRGARPATLSLQADGSGALRRSSGADRLRTTLAGAASGILGATVLRLEPEGDGVVTITESARLRSRAAVLCAGSLRTPGLLATAGVRSPRLGEGLMNHPGVMLPIDRGVDGAGHGTPPVSAVVDVLDGSGLRVGQLIAFEHIDATRRWAGLAAVLLRPVSRGAVTTGPASVVRPVVRVETSDHDLRLLGVVVRRALDALEPMGADDGPLGRVGIGPTHTVRSLRAMGDDALHEWVGRHVWHLSHPVGTCAMGGPESGSIVDHRGKVRGHGPLWVADASVMPEIVAVHPNTTVAAVAHRIAGFVGGSL